jgi:TM2 domain-containing membrane protein YozV
MDLLEQQLLMKQAEKKSPGLAAVMGFFFPWLGAFYTGHIGAGIVFLIIDFVFFALSIVGIGLFLLLVYGFAGAFQCHKWAKEVNEKNLAQLIQARRAATAATGV